MPKLVLDNPSLITLLQSQAGGGAQSVQVLLWVGALIVVAIIGGAIAMVLRRRMFDKESNASTGSLLEDLRRMRREGKLSDAEFERAKRTLTEKLARSLDDQRAQKDALRPRTGGQASKSARRSPGRGSGPGNELPPGYDLTGEPLPKPHDPE